jgi:hypothetical protein
LCWNFPAVPFRVFRNTVWAWGHSWLAVDVYRTACHGVFYDSVGSFQINCSLSVYNETSDYSSIPRQCHLTGSVDGRIGSVKDSVWWWLRMACEWWRNVKMLLRHLRRKTEMFWTIRLKAEFLVAWLRVHVSGFTCWANEVMRNRISVSMTTWVNNTGT